MPTEEEWISKVESGIERISDFFDHAENQGWIDQPARVIEQMKIMAYHLWERVMENPPRMPLALSMDCCYIICKMTGNRVSVRKMREASLFLFEKPVRVLATPKRSKIKWPLEERYAKIILHIVDDSEAYEDMVSEW